MCPFEFWNPPTSYYDNSRIGSQRIFILMPKYLYSQNEELIFLPTSEPLTQKCRKAETIYG